MTQRTRSALIPTLLLAAAASAACFSSETVIRVKPDGSGTIEQTNLANTQLIGMATSMAQAATKEAGGEDADISTANIEGLFDEAQLREQAANFGAGVRFVSSEKLTQGAMQGARAIYAFDDINALKMGSRSENGNRVPAPELSFAMSKGPGPRTLTITFPERASTEGAAEAAPSPVPTTDLPPEALAMVKSMFEGAHVGIDVEVDGGTIVSTDAPKRNGSRVTLLAFDFGQLLSDPSKLSALRTLKPGVDFATVQKALADVPGVTVPAKPKVTIQMR